MYCPKCGTQNASGARFCGKCGATMGSADNVYKAPQQSASAAGYAAAPRSSGSRKGVMVAGVAAALLVVTLLCCGIWPTLHWLELAYYLLSAWAFLTGFSLITSSLSAVYRDFFEFLNPIMRLLFYISSVVWPLESLPENLQAIMFLNPFAYIVEGYRKCLLYGEGFWMNWQQGLYFWALTAVLIVLGSTLHMRLRKRFIDQL